MNLPLTRRDILRDSLVVAGGMWLTGDSTAAQGSETTTQTATQEAPVTKPNFRYCLNTSTIRGQKLSIADEVALAARVGYQAIEPWISELKDWIDGGRKLSDLKKQIDDAGITVESAIGFASWIVDDPAERAKGLESLKHDMDWVRQLGGTRIAAPPVGATDQTDLNLDAAGERYHAILELGRKMGVVPQLELWGFSKTLHRLGQLVHVATEAAHDDACLLLDVYHIFKGGSDFAALNLIPGHAVHVLHMNDYPGTIPRETIGDKDRVYPGDGVAPVPAILNQLAQRGFQGVLSLELFNPGYWERPAEEVARTGLAKMKAVVAEM